ncbi:putative leader peptide [Streptomyces lydicus]|uniref:putative leader peptide n=1 Tax=Streptomyces lydicus TaxID=47763 RepID=UPI0037993480
MERSAAGPERGRRGRTGQRTRAEPRERGGRRKAVTEGQSEAERAARPGRRVRLPRLTLWERPCFTPRVTDHSSRFWRRVHLDLVRYAGCMCRPFC